MLYQLYILLLVTPWSRVLLEKPFGFQPVKKFPVFYGTRRFITPFTTARHLSPSWARSIQSIPPHPYSCRCPLFYPSIFAWVFKVVSFPSDFPTKTLFIPLLSPLRATCSAHYIKLYCIQIKMQWL